MHIGHWLMQWEDDILETCNPHRHRILDRGLVIVDGLRTGTGQHDLPFYSISYRI